MRSRLLQVPNAYAERDLPDMAGELHHRGPDGVGSTSMAPSEWSVRASRSSTWRVGTSRSLTSRSLLGHAEWRDLLYPELQEELAALGHTIRTRSDTRSSLTPSRSGASVSR